MKIRHGFVSNSSSSSFIVSMDVLNEEQIEKLMNYNPKYTFNGKYSGLKSNFDDCYFGDNWNVNRDKNRHQITGYTNMDNGDMLKYMCEVCEIDTKLVHFEGE